MKKKVLLLTLLVAALALVVVACGPTPAPAPKATEAPAKATTAPKAAVEDAWGVVTVKKGDPVQIGFAAGVSGNVANLGIDERNGAELAAKDFAEVKGFAVKMVAEDSLCSGEGGTAVANKFAANPQIVGVVGHMCSSSSIPASGIYEKAHIVMISPSSTAVAFTARGLAVTNRVCWNDAIQGAQAAKFVKDSLGVSNVAILHDGSAYGQGLVDVFKASFEKLGGTITDYEAITVGDKDFRAVLTKITANKPELIYFGGFQAEGALLVQQKDEVGLKDALFFSDDGTKSDQYIEAASGAAEGSYATFADFPSGSENLATFKDKYEAAYNAKAGELGPFNAHSYDAMAMMVAAINKVAVVDDAGNLEIGRKALADAVRGTKDYAGVTGNISCDDKGDCGTGTVVVNVVKDGKWAKVGGEAPAAGALPDLGGKEIIVAIENAYPPYNFIDPKTKEGSGWDYDAWNEICKRLNCTPKFTEAAWDGIFEAAAAGQYDVVADGVTITDKRKEVVAFSDPYMTYGQVVLVSADEKDITDKDTLVAAKDKLVGVQLGTTNEDTAKSLVGESRLKSFDTFDLAVVALMTGDVDAVIIDSTAASGFIAQNKGKLKIAGDMFTSEQLGFVFQQGSDLIAPTNAALAAMTADGALGALYTKWFEEYQPVKAEEETAPAEEATPQSGDGAAIPPAPDMAAVTPLLTKGTCGACHAIAGVEGAVGTIGPALCGLGEEVRAGEDSLDDVKTGIVDPNAEIVEGYAANIMPATFGDTYTAEELDTLIAFIANLQCE